MKRSEPINELAKALAAAQAEIKVAPKDNVAKTEKYSYSYSTLADVWEACRSALSKHGLSIVQTTETEGQKASVTTLLLHSSGQWIENTLTLAGRDGSPQSIGGCITYARRYALGAMVGVVSEEDDDGSDASGRAAQTGRKPASNGHSGGHAQQTSSAKQEEAPKDDPSQALCGKLKDKIVATAGRGELAQIALEIADHHKKREVNDAQKKWLDGIVKKRAEDIATLQENAA